MLPTTIANIKSFPSWKRVRWVLPLSLLFLWLTPLPVYAIEPVTIALIGIGLVGAYFIGGKIIGAAATAIANLTLGLAVYGAALIILTIVGYFIALEGVVIDWLMNPQSFPIANFEGVVKGWVIVRDLANLFFILALVWIAFSTMLRLESYGMRQALWRLIAAALLVNFSLLIGAAIIDFANVLTQQFLSPIGSVSKSLAGGFRIAYITLPDLDVFDPFLTFKAIAAVVFALIMAFLFLAAIILLTIRFLYLWILLIFAPLAWVAWIFPASRNLWTQWWNNFFRWTFFAPVFTFFMYLAFLILGSEELTERIRNIQSPEGFVGNDITPGNFMMFILTSGLLIAGLMSANWFSITGAGMVMNLGRGLRGWGLRGSVIAARRLGGRLGQLVGRPLAEHIPEERRRGMSLWQRIAASPGLALAKAVTAPMRGALWAAGAGVYSPEAWKRAMAALTARADGVAYNEASGRLQDAITFVATAGRRRTAWARLGQMRTEAMFAEELKPLRTEEQITAEGLKAFKGATAGNESDRAKLINILERLAAINGINTLEASFDEETKNSLRQLAIQRAREAGADDEYIQAMEQGNISHDPFMLRAILERGLGDATRGQRVANDIGVIARQAGNHSFSGISGFDVRTGQFRWNTFEHMQDEARVQFLKGQPQANMRNFHPDIFMRDAGGGLATTLNATGRTILTNFATGHFREIHQMRPETANHILANADAIRAQFTGAELEAVNRVIAGLEAARRREMPGGGGTPPEGGGGGAAPAGGGAR